MYKRLSLIIVLTLIVLALQNSAAFADTTYSPDSAPTVGDNGFASMAKVVIIGTSLYTFTGNDHVEFRFPLDFYITSAVVSTVYNENSDGDVVLQVVRGIDDPSAVSIKLIDEDSSNPGQYGGFAIDINSNSGQDGYKPEFLLHFKRVFVPWGYRGSVQVTAERGEPSGFSDSTFTIAHVADAKVELSCSRFPFLTVDRKIGPIVISENMGGAFQYVEMTLPKGFSWIASSAELYPGLGLADKKFHVSESTDKYGYSVLRVALQEDGSSTRGTLRVECDVDVSEDLVTFGDVNLAINGSSNIATSSLKVGVYSERNVTITSSQAKQLYGGLCDQSISEITISENTPDTIMANGKKITLQLPKWAKWANMPTVQISGTTELELGNDVTIGDDERSLSFSITGSSQKYAGKIVIKEAKVNVALDGAGDLIIEISGSAGVSGEVNVGNVKAPITATAASKPVLKPGLLGQLAGDIEIKENGGRVLLAKELWLDFPKGVTIPEKPVVQVSEGDLLLGPVTIDTVESRQRLIISIEASSSRAGTIRISGLKYDISALMPDGDLNIQIGGTSINEVNQITPALFPGNDLVASVANGVIGDSSEVTPEKQTPGPINAVFRIGEESYTVNNQTNRMDIAPYIENGRTFIPLRYVGYSLGIEPEDILWDDNNKTASLFKSDIMVQFKIGENTVYRSGAMIAIDTAAQIHKDRVMVPIRAISEAFGAKVEWDENTQTVNIML